MLAGVPAAAVDDKRRRVGTTGADGASGSARPGVLLRGWALWPMENGRHFVESCLLSQTNSTIIDT